MSAKGPLLLVVDDSEIFLDIVGRYLEAAGFRVRTVADSRLAAELADRIRPSLALVDVEMPHLHGLQLMRDLRLQAPRLPVVALTLNDAPPYRDAALNAGADAFVGKDVLHEQLLPAVERLLAA